MINPPVLTTGKEQTHSYPDSAIPFGFLLIARELKDKGHSVKMINALHECNNAVTEFDTYAIGSDSIQKKKVFLLGKTMSELALEISGEDDVDEIYLTSSISYNYPVIQELIRLCRSLHPNSKIVLGGAYVKTDTDHALTLGVDRIFSGRIKEDGIVPDYSIIGYEPKILVFRLFLGCKNKCNFCANCLEDHCAYDVSFVLDYLKVLENRYHPRLFRNWDPNVLLSRDKFITFLREYRKKLVTPLGFDMGLQPDLLDNELLDEMRQSGVKTITIPFDLYSGHKRPNTIISSVKALSKIRDQAFFEKNNIHCTFIIGYPDDDFRKLMLALLTIKHLGGRPNCFPITPIRGTSDYNKYKDVLDNKDLKEWNGNLWPLISSSMIKDHEDFYMLTYCNDNREFLDILNKSSDHLRKCYHDMSSRVEHFIKLCLDCTDSETEMNEIFHCILS